MKIKKVKSGAGFETILFRKVVADEKRDTSSVADKVKRFLTGGQEEGDACKEDAPCREQD